MKKRLTRFLSKKVLLGCAAVLVLSAIFISWFGTTAFVVTLLVMTLICFGTVWFFSEKPPYLDKHGRLRLSNHIRKS